MGDSIVKRLYHMKFPYCSKEALSFLAQYISQDHPGIPGLSANTEQIIVEICQEFVLFKSARGKPKTLSAVQELTLLDMICACFTDAPEQSKYRLFNLMFGAGCSTGSVPLLTKLVSLALSTQCAPVLFCAAIWMQERDSLSGDMKALTERLVSDYCLLYPDPASVFSRLPAVSPLFACNIITAATSYYSFAGGNSLPPLALVQHVCEWLVSDPSVCCESLRQATVHHAYTTPVPGLAGWCVRGPVVCHTLTNQPKSKVTVEHTQIPALSSCLQHLHLTLLQCLTFSASVHLPPGLLSAADLAHITHTLPAVLPSNMENQDEDTDGPAVVALDRLAQILQVASATRTFVSDRGKIKEMESVARQKLPPNRLLSMVLAQQLQTS